MKKSKIILFAALFVAALIGLTGCPAKDYHILVSTQDLRFGLEPGSDTLIISADCKWTISKNDNADWYSLSTMSGKAKDSIVIVTVKDYSDGDWRGSSFVVRSPGGHVHRTVFVSQNKLDFYGIVNKVFGVFTLEHWNTDFFGMIVEDTYKLGQYDPFDTTMGYWMYYMEDGKGLQRDHHNDSVVCYQFDYSYDADSSLLHITFLLQDSTFEYYSAEVLCASDSLYRIFHEYEPHWLERADMRKVGVILPDTKELLTKNVKPAKRKKGQPIFIMD